METARKFTWGHFLFVVAIVLKGLNGLVELVLGALITVMGPDRLFFFVAQYTTPELEANPSNHIARALQNSAAGLANTMGFAIFYLFAHGVLKTAIAYNLLRDRRWVFAPACVILGGFVIYLFYHAAQKHSAWAFGFGLFDFFTIALVINEWRRLPARA
ncbi:MAG TPA: DUF2127 domain-containing protein [Rhizomicrobium sp.]|nr:DUF2127 domain-containing protein [Rhizomicrobium sp.]